MESTIPRVLTRSILAGTLATTMRTGTALGHECFVASRSDTGGIKAVSNAKVWLTVATLSGLFGPPPALCPGAAHAGHDPD